jgi:mannose-6-phosphate isomerase-like protein (cupin superfamily)
VKAWYGKAEQIDRQRGESGQPYREFLRVPAMSAGLYVLGVGASDPQRPHHEDEMYYVIRGRARFQAGDEDQEVGPGSVLFVSKELEHRFHAIQQELAVLVFFAPAES